MFYPTKTNLCCRIHVIIGFLVFSWGMVNLAGDTLLEKTVYPSSSSWNFLIVPSLGIRFFVQLFFPCWDFFFVSACTFFMKAFTATVISYVRMFYCAYKTLFLCSHFSSLALAPFPFLLMYPWNLGREGVAYMYYMTEHPVVSLS